MYARVDAPASHGGREHSVAHAGRGLGLYAEPSFGEVVHLTAHNPPSFGVARIGPVFTPKEHRGQGYASAGVAGVSRLLREQGADVCLYTDQANPTSNKIYAAIGYVPVVDQGNWGITRPGPA